ncbi:MAG: hypothetical protein RBS72_15000 [Sedimentisphaerales bacterium]|jgi:hypothetical protein|nr:hypothetical protein [Sedimentisphaerales bacterium]NLX22549.1 hypothetical protein [Phycisphaerae bacterium]HNY80780.1 hypothetical protein [Sedimentisphaerales bacterium]HOC62290.1 hypothetical protein [Sedimentisphaerales bacterium]HOH66629.1 hypothetical protein [Sedimentisphaerales bacterium]
MLQPLPIDAHPDVIVNKSPALNPARSAAKTLWDTWAKLREAEAGVSDKRRLAEAARKTAERALAVTDKALAELQANRDTTEARIAAVVCPKTPDPLGGEIRTHLKGQKHSFILLSDLVRKGDRRTIAAVFAGPAYLSGLDEKQYAALRDLARETWCREDAETVRDIDRAAGRLMLTAQHVSTTLAPLVKKWSGTDDKVLEGLK